MKQLTTFLLFIFIGLSAKAQPLVNEADVLRGSLNENRDWFDIKRYVIDVTPNYDSKSIVGVVSWKAIAVKPSKQIQIDLQTPMVIDSILLWPNVNEGMNAVRLEFTRSNNIAIAQIEKQIPKGKQFGLTIFYHGVPKEAIRPPWDGGWIWKKDANGQPWMSVACQGLGASVWYPCKDHQSDEPEEGAQLTIQVPKDKNIIAIGNGRKVTETNLINLSDNNRFSWQVTNPINNYNIIPYIGDYVGWKENYKGLKGKLDLSYWVLRSDSAKAVEQFKQVPKMLEAFEYWFGPYPFYEDGFQLVQSPHLGMEHQSAIAYGNRYMNGYLGRDLSGSGWGLKWDYIIVHESGHEWFANNISTKDIADMWVHEGFTSYSEILFTEYFYGKKAGDEYNYGIRSGIKNDIPIIGPYGVNQEGSGDMYRKGANLIHTIRHAINNDSLFRNILIGLNKQFYHQTVTTEQVENYISVRAGFGFQKVFDQYLRTIQIPVFSYNYNEKEKILTYQYKNCVTGFNLPLHFNYLGKNYSFMPMDYQPQQRLIQDSNFNLQDFVKTIESQYYIRLEEVK
jgi:aminopeptidase N